MLSWVPELLLWLGRPGLPACFSGGLLCPVGGFCCRVCRPWYRIWFPRGNYGCPKNLAAHYHVLTKRELTKEYVVEDLHGNYTPPNLDPEHEERLRMLKLL